MQSFRDTIHGVLLMQDRHRRLFSAMRISAWEKELQYGSNPLHFRFPILCYSSLFNRLGTTERAFQPEQADFQVDSPTVGTSLIP